MSKHTSKIKAVQERIYQIMRETSPYAIIASRKMLALYSYVETINKSSVPIIFMKGSNDIDINKSIMKIHKILDQNNNVRFIELEDGGHIVNLEQPMKYNQVIEEYMQ